MVLIGQAKPLQATLFHLFNRIVSWILLPTMDQHTNYAEQLHFMSNKFYNFLPFTLSGSPVSVPPAVSVVGVFMRVRAVLFAD